MRKDAPLPQYMFHVKLKACIFVPKFQCNFLRYIMDFLSFTGQRGNGRVDHHTHSLLISKAYPYFMNFCTRIRQLIQFLIKNLVIIQLVLLVCKEKTYIFCQNFTFPIFLFLFIIADCCVDQCEPRNRFLLIMS